MHDTEEVSTMKAGISNSWGFDMPHLLQVSSLIETTRNFVDIVASQVVSGGESHNSLEK